MKNDTSVGFFVLFFFFARFDKNTKQQINTA